MATYKEISEPVRAARPTPPESDLPPGLQALKDEGKLTDNRHLANPPPPE